MSADRGTSCKRALNYATTSQNKSTPMMYTSRDYTFTRMLDYRFTQYRCPSCKSYHVAIKSVVNWPDASANVAVGEGEMECQICEFVEKGKMFQIKTMSHEDGDILNEQMKSIMHDVGDEWINTLSKKYEI